MDAKSLRVMTFNLWHGGEAGKQPLEQSARVVQAAQADVVGFQESFGQGDSEKAASDNAAKIAQRLGWHYLAQGSGTGIASRFPIVSHTPQKWGAELMLDSGRLVWLFNVHLMYTPYQPYQLLNIPYNGAPFLKTEAEAIQAAHAARGEQVRQLLAEVRAIQESRHKNELIFLTGDFNEPSHLDWTSTAAAAGHCPLKVEWPSTKTLFEAGLRDAYRLVYPDPTAHRGLTWTPTTALNDPHDRHDRIDFVFVGEQGAVAHSAQIVGESPLWSDTVVEPYPSDHRAVVVAFHLT